MCVYIYIYIHITPASKQATHETTRHDSTTALRTKSG